MRKQVLLMSQGTNELSNNGITQTNTIDDNESNTNVHLASLTRGFLLDILQKKGEKMTREELLACFEQLTGYPRKQLQKIIPEQINMDFLVSKLLGLEMELV